MEPSLPQLPEKIVIYIFATITSVDNYAKICLLSTSIRAAAIRATPFETPELIDWLRRDWPDPNGRMTSDYTFKTPFGEFSKNYSLGFPIEYFTLHIGPENYIAWGREDGAIKCYQYTNDMPNCMYLHTFIEYLTQLFPRLMVIMPISPVRFPCYCVSCPNVESSILSATPVFKSLVLEGYHTINGQDLERYKVKFSMSTGAINKALVDFNIRDKYWSTVYILLDGKYHRILKPGGCDGNYQYLLSRMRSQLLNDPRHH